MAGFLSAASAAIGASSIGSALVRILIAYGVSRLINGNTGDQNDKPVDEGVRLQLQPNTTNPIPLLYGSAYFSGNITDAQLTNNNQTMWVCLTLSEHTTQNRLSDNALVDTFFEEIYLNDQLITFKADGITVDYATNSDGSVDASARDLIKIYLYKNGSEQPTLPSDFLGGTLPGNAYTLFPGWDSNWSMTNLTFALVRVDYNRDKGITGIPNLKFKVSNTLFKPGDALYDYMTGTVSGAALPAAQIDTASLIALNNYADDAINFYNEDTDDIEVLANRYQINGIINPQQNVLKNMQEIANSTGVYINYDITTGKWGVIIDRDETAVHHFDDSNIVGGIDVTATSLDSMYNAVEVEFPSRFIQDQTDSIRINLPVEFRNDNEPDNTLNIRLSMLNEPVQARELGYLALYQNRLDRVVTFTTDYSKIQVASGDIITLTNDIYGFDLQPLRVIRVKEIESDVGSILVEITAQEYDSTLYTAGGQPRRPRTPTAPITLPSLGVIATPVAPIYTTANNNRQPSILLSGVVPDGVVDRFEFWYSTDNFATSFLIHEEKNANGAPFNSDTTIVARIATLPAGTYTFKVRAGNETSYSDYSPASTELVWAPVQTTDEITNETGFSFGGLLPVIAAGVLGYLAYKTLYPALLEALSDTELGELLGVTSPSEVEAIKQQAELQSNAFRFITVGSTQLSSADDPTVTFVAGAGIEFSVNEVGHEITISTTSGEQGLLTDLNDVTITNAGDGQVLLYDGVNSQWKNVELIGETGINIATSGTDIRISATGEADAANAFSKVTADATTLNAGVSSGHLYIKPGQGIKLTSNANTNEITIDNTCCDENVDTTSFKDGGRVNVTNLDDPSCIQTTTWPTKKDKVRTPGDPAVPQTWINIIGEGTWYDECYRTTVPTLKLDDPDKLLDEAISSQTAATTTTTTTPPVTTETTQPATVYTPLQVLSNSYADPYTLTKATLYYSATENKNFLLINQNDLVYGGNVLPAGSVITGSKAKALGNEPIYPNTQIVSLFSDGGSGSTAGGYGLLIYEVSTPTNYEPFPVGGYGFLQNLTSMQINSVTTTTVTNSNTTGGTTTTSSVAPEETVYIELIGKLIPDTTLQIDWKDTIGSAFEDKTIKLRRIGTNEYVAIKNWSSTDGSALPLTGDVCNISDPWSRPLFTTVDYPNGYEFATISNLQNLLIAQGSSYRFIYVSATGGTAPTETDKEYPGKIEVTRKPRTCVKTVEATVSIARVDFRGTISTDVLWLAPETPGGTDFPTIPIGSEITGTYTSQLRQDLITANTMVLEKIADNRYLLNKTYPTLTTVGDGTMITMYYPKPVKATIKAADAATADYNNASDDFGVVNVA